MISYSAHLGQPWATVSVTAFCKDKLLRCGSKESLVSGEAALKSNQKVISCSHDAHAGVPMDLPYHESYDHKWCGLYGSMVENSFPPLKVFIVQK